MDTNFFVHSNNRNSINIINLFCILSGRTNERSKRETIFYGIRHVCVTVSLGPPFAAESGSIFWERNDTSCANHLGGSPVNCSGPQVPATQTL